MNLYDLDTKKQSFEKIQRYLKESFGYSLKTDTLTEKKVERMIETATKKLATIDQKKSPRAYARTRFVIEGLKLWEPAPVQTELTQPAMKIKEDVTGDTMEEAKVILAAQEISDKIQKMIEDVAQLQVQDLLPIVDAMRTEIGTAEADAFNSSMDSALGSLLDSLKSSKEEVANAILSAQGQQTSTDMDQPDDTFGVDDVDMSAMDDADTDFDDEMGDEFGGDDASADAELEPEGRELKAESFDRVLSRLSKKVSESGKISKKDLAEAIASIAKSKKAK